MTKHFSAGLSLLRWLHQRPDVPGVAGLRMAGDAIAAIAGPDSPHRFLKDN